MQKPEGTELLRSLKGMARLLALPEDVLPGSVSVQLIGDGELVAQGIRGVLEYGETRIRLAAPEFILMIEGEGLRIRLLTQESAVVVGRLQTISYQ